MDFGILINAVEGQKCLYDKRDTNYKNSGWTQIAEVTDMPSKFIAIEM